jgi:hypothetical protein
MKVSDEPETPEALLPGRTRIPIEKEAGCAPDLLWTVLEKREFLATDRTQNPNFPTCSLVPIQTELPQNLN